MRSLMRKLLLLSPVLCLSAVLVADQPPSPQPQAPKPKRPGVSTPGIKIPIAKLKPDQVFDVPGVPDWLAIDEHVWVSNYPKNSVTRIDPASNTVVDTITVGRNP